MPALFGADVMTRLIRPNPQPDICTMAAEAGVPEVVVDMLTQHAGKADVCRQCCLVVRPGSVGVGVGVGWRLHRLESSRRRCCLVARCP